MIVLTTFWGNHPGYAGLLNDWVDAYLDSGTTFPFLVLTDLETPNTKFPTLRVDVSNQSLFMRPNHKFDRKGALMLEALKIIEGPILFLDTDAVVRRPIQDHIGKWKEAEIAITRDTGVRKIDAGWGEPKYDEMCAGVMYFGGGNKDQLIRHYQMAFGQLHLKHPTDGLLEQMAWSMLWKRVGGAQLPDSFGWVERHWGNNPNAVIIHNHGPAKLMKYSLNASSPGAAGVREPTPE